MCDGNPKIFVAEIEHLVVGYVHATKYDLLYANSMVNIMGSAVLEEYRHNGIATKLMDSVEEWAQMLSGLHLEKNKNNYTSFIVVLALKRRRSR